MNEPNDNLKDLAADVLSSQELPEDKFGSVIMIIMMVAILVNVIRVIQECQKDKEENDIEFYRERITGLSKQRGWFTKMRLKKILRKQMSKEDYKLHANSLVKAILDKGERITDEEILTLMEAIK